MTTATVVKPRHRAWMPKTKTGCKTCKIRKVKCDEAKPHCKRCTSTGRMCDGYDPAFAPTQIEPTRTSVQSTSPPALSPSAVDFASEIRSFSVLSYLAPSLRLETIDERLSFQFFVTQAGPALSGYSDTSFWQRQVLQAAHQHAPIQHCLVALGAMYRKFHESTSSHIDDVSNEHFRFALSQSNKAIQHLVKHQKGAGIADKLIFMTCCILFGSMANLQGQQQAALRHLRSGMRMLKEIECHDSGDIPHHPIELDSLHSIFTGLDIQARSSLGWEEIKHWEPALGARHASPSTNRDFDTCLQSELHQLTEILLNDTLAFNRGCVTRPYSDRAAIQTTYQSLIDRFDRATHRLTTLVGTTPTPSPTLTATLLLNAQTHHYLRAAIPPLAHHFSVTGTLSHVPFSPTAHFTTMMSHIAALLPHTSSSPIYTLSPGPLCALWLIATSAPSSCVALRKQAIDLMLAQPRREGLFDGRLAGRIGRAAWALEQEATRRELGVQGKEGVVEGDLVVLEHLRLVWMDIQYEDEEIGERRARVKLANAGEMGTGGGTVVVIDW